MIVLTFPQDRHEILLERCGYVFHRTQDKDGYKMGYIRSVPGKKRFHALSNGKEIRIHIDLLTRLHKKIFIKGLEKEEMMRICRIHNEIWPKKGTSVYAPNLREIQKRKVVLRHWLNPLRYLISPLKQI